MRKRGNLSNHRYDGIGRDFKETLTVVTKTTKGKIGGDNNKIIAKNRTIKATSSFKTVNGLKDSKRFNLSISSNNYRGVSKSKRIKGEK